MVILCFVLSHFFLVSSPASYKVVEVQTIACSSNGIFLFDYLITDVSTEDLVLSMPMQRYLQLVILKSYCSNNA